MSVVWGSCEDVTHIDSIFVSGFVAMVIAACVVNFHRAVGLLVISLVTIFFLVWDWMMERYGEQVWEALAPIRDLLSRNRCGIRWWEMRQIIFQPFCSHVHLLWQRNWAPRGWPGGLRELIFSHNDTGRKNVRDCKDSISKIPRWCEWCARQFSMWRVS